MSGEQACLASELLPYALCYPPSTAPLILTNLHEPYVHFADAETETQRVKVICPKVSSEQNQPSSGPVPSDLQSWGPLSLLSS